MYTLVRGGPRTHVPSGKDSRYVQANTVVQEAWYTVTGGEGSAAVDGGGGDVATGESTNSVVITYSLPRAGQYSLMIAYNHSGLYGFPSALLVRSAETSANHTIPRGLNLHRARAGGSSAFLIEARDAFGNLQTAGGDRWYVRLAMLHLHDHNVDTTHIGSDAGAMQAVTAGSRGTVYGLSKDLGNGAYRVAYRAPALPSLYTLRVELLHRAKHSLAGGGGLTGHYFASPDLSGAPVVVREDTRISFQWGLEPVAYAEGIGLSLHRDASRTKASTSTASAKSAPPSAAPMPFGSVMWTGFLVPGVDDVCLFTVRTQQALRLYLEDDLVASRDEAESDASDAAAVSAPIPVIGKVPLALRLEVTDADSALPFDVSLLWRCRRTDEEVLPSVFLYPDSSPVQNSPYIVDVVSD